VRLQRLLAGAGLCSRRQAEQWLRQGRVSVNGRPAKLGESADPARDRVEVDGERLRLEALAYWMLHKPRGPLSTRRDPQGRPTVMELLPPGLPRLHPVGRLDADTEGLLLLTNDGPLTHRLLHPSHGAEREYRVWVRGRVEPGTIRRLEAGVALRDGRTAPCRVSGVRHDATGEGTRFDLVLREGRKRQIRRSLGALRHPVGRLVRTRMGSLRLGSLRPGEARPLVPEELGALRRYAEALPDPPAGAVTPRRSRTRQPAPSRRAPPPGRAGPRP